MRKLVLIVALLLMTNISFAQFVYTHPRMDPVRGTGIGLEGASLDNFGREEELVLEMEWCGFTSADISEGKAKWARTEYTVWEVDPGFEFEDMASGKLINRLRSSSSSNRAMLRGTGAGTFGYYEQYIRLEVSSGKVLRVVQSCANAIKTTHDGRRILGHTVTKTIRGKDVVRTVEKDIYLTTTITHKLYNEVESSRIDTETIVRTVRGDIPQLGSAFGQVVGSPVTKVNPAIYATISEQQKKEECCKTPRPPPPPGHGPGNPPPPPIVHRPGAPPQGPPNPQKPWVDPSWPWNQLNGRR